MLNRVFIDETISDEDNISSILILAQSICDDVFAQTHDSQSSIYKYDYSKPAEELGLDEELIVHLIEDYISQIFKTYKNFYLIIDRILDSAGLAKEKALKDLNNLAHKNLGVARNLRIYDAQILLSELMTNREDFKYLKECTEALVACAYKLNPEYGYHILKLNKLKTDLVN